MTIKEKQEIVKFLEHVRDTYHFMSKRRNKRREAPSDRDLVTLKAWERALYYEARDLLKLLGVDSAPGPSGYRFTLHNTADAIKAHAD